MEHTRRPNNWMTTGQPQSVKRSALALRSGSVRVRT